MNRRKFLASSAALAAAPLLPALPASGGPFLPLSDTVELKMSAVQALFFGVREAVREAAFIKLNDEIYRATRVLEDPVSDHVHVTLTRQLREAWDNHWEDSARYAWYNTKRYQK